MSKMLIYFIMVILCLNAVSTKGYTSINVQDFINGVSQANSKLVFFIDSAKKASAAFLPKLEVIVESVTKDFPDVKVLLVDNQDLGGSTEEEDLLFEKQNIFEFPSVKLYMRGVGIPTDLPLTAKGMGDFLKMKVKQFVLPLTDLKKINPLPTNKKSSVFFYSTNKNMSDFLNGIAHKFHSAQFYSTNLLILKELIAGKPLAINEDPNLELIIVLQREIDGSVYLLSLKKSSRNMDRIVKFLSRHTTLNWQNFNNKSAYLVDSTLKSVMLFTFDQSLHQKELEHVKAALKSANESIVGILVEKDNFHGINYLESLGFPIDQPGMYIISRNLNGRLMKFMFKPVNGYSTPIVKNFIEDCLDNTYPFFIPSPTLYKNIATLTATDIKKKRFASSKGSHLVFFYDFKTVNQIPAFERISEQMAHKDIKFYIFNTTERLNSSNERKNHGKIVLYSGTSAVVKVFKFEDHLKAREVLNFLMQHIKEEIELAGYLKSIQLSEEL